ncbi:TPA: hypothetical protein ACRNL1_000873 [Pseudomonas aeruginosa]|uniref:hypothetical protein n=1 Tax=Pseudomonas aeruginosa TaxID=287 RepID=UPI00071B146C|nr:hypothetical protein [Pseudomonas aeruginosa]KSI44637.1 hypothetical protein AO986_02045 [Pseudomonas aeruginosa]MBV5536327.1 hypothetical protein [Pseudomonas aeruginosa]PBW17909.1 hypothetical protein CJU17_16260 [Pseudomonas aeruginosa]PBW23542.1 hypothetical protein CJU16_18425 [Pseudomonas aeruginosa]PBW30299.1 hypothetical protein CJU14_13475 [Pseudomonas aeruginosa]
MIDPVEFGKAMGAIVREATAPLIERIDWLEKALTERPDLEAIAKQVAALIPIPKDGEPGQDADMEALKAHLGELVKAIPAPADGLSVVIDDVVSLIRDEVAKAFSDLPPPTPGKDADMEALRAHLGDLVKGIQLPTVPTIDEVAATFERRFSDLTLSWERQARETFDKAADRMPIPKDGRDALPLESFDLALGDDGRTVTVKMQAGDTVIEKSVKVPAIIDRGVFSAEKSYEQGDGTTYGGCYWIAQKDAPEGFPGGSTDWRLAVKKGRDGKDLRDNASKHDPSKGVKIRKDEDDDK